MNIDDYMLNDNALKRKKLLVEMNEYSKNNDSKSEEYKNRYNHYLTYLAVLDSNDEEYLEDEIDIVKHKHNPYLKLKYFISEYISYYYKIIKKEYFKITKKIYIKLDIDNLDKTIKELEKNINKLSNEEKINYILNVNEIINNNLR